MNNKITPEEIRKMSYVELMAFLGEINRPPGGKDSIRQLVQNCFITKESSVLDVGCNTGYCTFEVAHLVKCRVVGVDISPAMIETAREFQKPDPLGKFPCQCSTCAQMECHIPFSRLCLQSAQCPPLPPAVQMCS